MNACDCRDCQNDHTCRHCGERTRHSHGPEGLCCSYDYEERQAVEALEAADPEHSDDWWNEAMALAGVMR